VVFFGVLWWRVVRQLAGKTPGPSMPAVGSPPLPPFGAGFEASRGNFRRGFGGPAGSLPTFRSADRVLSGRRFLILAQVLHDSFSRVVFFGLNIHVGNSLGHLCLGPLRLPQKCGFGTDLVLDANSSRLSETHA